MSEHQQPGTEMGDLGVAPHDHDRDYEALRTAVAQAFTMAARNFGPIFRARTATAPTLWEIYLDGLPEAERQIHNCRICARFFRHYGSLVTIDGTGGVASALWEPDLVPPFYREVVTRLRRAAIHEEIEGVFFPDSAILGTPHTGVWSHFWLLAEGVADIVVPSPGQAKAAALENYRTVRVALAEFKPAVLDEGLRILQAEALPRAERFVGPMRWLRELQIAAWRPQTAPANRRARDNLIWRAVATAPEGYCHPRASMIGSLLEDIAAGKPFAAVRGSFMRKVAPNQYQRPQVAPAPANIAAAEAIVAQLGIAPSLKRRYATLADIPELLWQPAPAPKPEAPAADKVFGHVKPKAEPGAQNTAKTTRIPAAEMTWEKFARIVLPDAEAVELWLDQIGAFLALTTAVHPEAPPVLKWDRPQERNPAAWYVWPAGSPATQWGLKPNGFCRVYAITALPTMWGHRPMPFLGTGAVLLLEGAAETAKVGSALFPETLREELHGVRATIEAFSRAGGLEPVAQPACGWDLRSGRKEGWPVTLRVLNPTGWTTYRLDRWD